MIPAINKKQIMDEFEVLFEQFRNILSDTTNNYSPEKFKKVIEILSELEIEVENLILD